MNISNTVTLQTYSAPQPQPLRAQVSTPEAQEGRSAEKTEPKQMQKTEPGEGGSMINTYV